MPKDEISNPRKAPVLAIDDADDEVIDLLEVVKPGRGLKQDAGGDDRDFGADLDAMLDGLSEAGVEAAAPDIPDQPAPFPDPTPVDHKVDHNETLDLPGMDDLDNLLKSFGAPGADSGTEETEDPDFADVDLSMPDLDALPASPAVSKKAAPGPVAPDFESAAPAAVAAKPAKKAIPAPEEDELLASLLADASAPPAAAKSGKPAPPALMTICLPSLAWPLARTPRKTLPPWTTPCSTPLMPATPPWIWTIWIRIPPVMCPVLLKTRMCSETWSFLRWKLATAPRPAWTCPTWTT